MRDREARTNKIQVLKSLTKFFVTYFVFIGFVDQLLSNYDKDEDGRLNFIEFFSSYEEAKDTLKIS